jgi:hypothetical protein
MQNKELGKISEDELKNGIEGLIRFANVSLGATIHHLERLATSLRVYSAQDGHMIDGTKVPEYQKARNALEQYKNALIEKIKHAYKNE